MDNFIQYNLMASGAREAFARAAKAFLRRGGAGDRDKAVALLDAGLEKMPPAQIRYTFSNTFPFLEAYYAAGEMEKGDALLLSYAENLMQYLDYYLAFEGVQGDMVSGLIDDKLDELGQIYLLAGYAGRRDAVARLNDYYRTLGATDEDLLHVDAPGEATDSLLPIP